MNRLILISIVILFGFLYFSYVSAEEDLDEGLDVDFGDSAEEEDSGGDVSEGFDEGESSEDIDEGLDVDFGEGSENEADLDEEVSAGDEGDSEASTTEGSASGGVSVVSDYFYSKMNSQNVLIALVLAGIGVAIIIYFVISFFRKPKI